MTRARPFTPPTDGPPPAAPWPTGPGLAAARPRAWRRALPWVVLVTLLGIAQTLLIVLSLQAESTRLQEESERTAVAVAADLRLRFGRHQQALQALSWSETLAPDDGPGSPRALLRDRRDMLRIEQRDARLALRQVLDSPFRGVLFAPAGSERMTDGLLPRAQLDLELQLACTSARRLMLPRWSRSYFVPQPGGLGLEVIDLCLPLVGRDDDPGGYVIATVALGLAIEEAVPPATLRTHELALVEGDGTRLVRVGGPRGAGVYLAERLLDLPGLGLALRVDTDRRGPPLIPNLSTGLVIGLSLALAAVVALLVRDVRRRAAAEQRLAEELALRRAMEDSLVTGLRARDLQGRITYVNPAFCAMVGFPAHELVGQLHPPYWPPEQRSLYQARWSERLTGQLPPREGFETLFMRADGERFPVLVFEAPLVDAQGRQAGWMSAVLDVSAQRRAEELARQQQDKLQTAARLATVGEIATLLSHELNQPLAAIASYATGSLNLLGGPPPAGPPEAADAATPPDAPTFGMIREAVQRIAEQAERAGRVIKSVHDVVRRREQPREALPAAGLFEAVLPLIHLQARKSGTRIALDLPRRLPEVRCDRTMIEQVLLNLTRNAVHAMEAATPPEQRELTLRVREEAAAVRFEVIDRGPGIPDEVAAQLFTPFFTTKAEGMGLGLNFCRTVIEQHGGTLRHAPAPVAGAGPRAAPGLRGSCFSFTLPRVAAPESSTP